MGVVERGRRLLADPQRTKGTAFSRRNGGGAGLLGLLPAGVQTLEEQIESVLVGGPAAGSSDLDRYVYLRSLQDRNERLFYSLLAAHVAGDAAARLHADRGRGLPALLRDLAAAARPVPVLAGPRAPAGGAAQPAAASEVDVIVVTDGQRILGIGDQGVGGMGIPIGKLSLYTLIGGIDPARTLPILLDVGTDNADAARGPLLPGLAPPPHRRRRLHRVRRPRSSRPCARSCPTCCCSGRTSRRPTPCRSCSATATSC